MAMAHEPEAVVPPSRERVYVATVDAIEAMRKLKVRDADPV
jgi:hypothetical protein